VVRHRRGLSVIYTVAGIQDTLNRDLCRTTILGNRQLDGPLVDEFIIGLSHLRSRAYNVNELLGMVDDAYKSGAPLPKLGDPVLHRLMHSLIRADPVDRRLIVAGISDGDVGLLSEVLCP